jgi:hypothetical protein
LIYLIKNLLDDSDANEITIKEFENIFKDYVIFEDEKIYFTNINDKELCKLFSDVLKTKLLIHNKNFKSQVYFLKKYNINKYLLYESFALIQDCEDNKNSFFQTIKRMINFFLERKTLTVTIITTIAFLIYIGMKDDLITIPYFEKVEEKIEYINSELEPNVLFDSRINQDDVKYFCKSNNINVSKINVNNDNVITLEEYKQFKFNINLYNKWSRLSENTKAEYINERLKSIDYIDYGVPKKYNLINDPENQLITLDDIRILPNMTMDEILKKIDFFDKKREEFARDKNWDMYYFYQNQFDKYNKIYNNKSWKESWFPFFYGKKEELDMNLNPLKNFLESNNLTYEENVTLNAKDMQVILDIGIIHNEFTIQYDSSFFTRMIKNILDWYKGTNNLLFTQSITVYANKLNDGRIVYDILNGYDIFLGSMFVANSNDLNFNVNVIYSNNHNHTIFEFINLMKNAPGSIKFTDL